MNNIRKVQTCLKKLDFSSLSSDNFQDKIIIQKVTCLLQLKGMRFPYHFNLWVRGPYSPDLTKEVYGNAEEFLTLREWESLKPIENGMVDEFKETIGVKPAQLEVAATYAFLVYELGYDALTATGKVRQIKGFFPESQLALGISKAKQFLHKPSIASNSEVQREALLWDSASLGIGDD